jgi:hypothetical protein
VYCPLTGFHLAKEQSYLEGRLGGGRRWKRLSKEFVDFIITFTTVGWNSAGQSQNGQQNTKAQLSFDAKRIIPFESFILE